MSRTLFVRAYVVRWCSNPDNADACIDQAEKVWERLSARGHGDKKAAKPRDTVDWYGKLSAYQKEWFDRFWVAFAYKHARHRAAKSWHQLGELPEAEYRRIVEAARQEARRPIPEGQSRKMAEGWLSERRFDDFTSPVSTPTKKEDPRKGQLREQLKALEQLQNYKPTPERKQQIDDLKALMSAL
jgi:hypothetical protein